MSDLISKNAVDELIDKLFHDKNKSFVASPFVWYTLKEIQGIQPSADVRENVRGGWYLEEEPDGYYHAICSVCDYWADEDAYKYNWNFCPNCGADMRGEEDGGRT